MPNHLPPDPRKAIIVSVDKNGHVNQCLALCEMLGWPVAAVKRITGGSRMDSAWQKFAKQLKRLYDSVRSAPWYKTQSSVLLVVSGVSSEAVAAAYRKRYGDELFAIFVGAPKSKKPIYDIVIASNHAKLSTTADFIAAKSTLWISGVLVRNISLGKANLERRGLVVLIGGINKAFKLDAQRIGDQIASVAERRTPNEPAIVIVFSRRTS